MSRVYYTHPFYEGQVVQVHPSQVKMLNQRNDACVRVRQLEAASDQHQISRIAFRHGIEQQLRIIDRCNRRMGN